MRIRFTSLIAAIGIGLAANCTALSLHEPPPALVNPAAAASGNVLDDYRGQIVYIDFWASWCPPCRRALPALEGLHQKYGKAGFQVIAVNVDENAADMASFLSQFPVSYRQIKDPNGRLAENYGVTAMPSGYLIDHEGNLVTVHRGFLKGDEASLQQAVESLLKKAGLAAAVKR